MGKGFTFTISTVYRDDATTASYYRQHLVTQKVYCTFIYVYSLFNDRTEHYHSTPTYLGFLPLGFASSARKRVFQMDKLCSFFAA